MNKKKKNSLWRPFAEGRAFVWALDLKNEGDWRAYCKSDDKPTDIPANPRSVYGQEFKGIGDWLGTGNIRNREWRPFEDARTFVRALGLKNQKDWRRFSQSDDKPDDIPSNPHRTYRSLYQGLGDWIGTEIAATRHRQYRSFEDARAYIHMQKLKNGREWSLYCQSGKLPVDIPRTPRQVYRSEFISLDDWLGTGKVPAKNRQYRPFKDARTYVRSLGIKNLIEWRKYCSSPERPLDIPAKPKRVYGSQFKGLGDWLGTGVEATRERIFLPFEEARACVQGLGIKNNDGWREYCNSGTKPQNIPSSPESVYGDDFKGYGDWLGNGNLAPGSQPYLPFAQARQLVRAIGLKNSLEWREYCISGRKRQDIPANPYQIYQSEFQGMGDWLGTERLSGMHKHYNFLPYNEARRIVHSLALKSVAEWRAYCTSGKKPATIPTNPDKVYPSEFMGMGEWLGTDISDELPGLSIHQKDLEDALLQLHSSQQLSSGQIMILMRHAGMLSKYRYLHTVQRLQSAIGQLPEAIQAQLQAIEAAIDESDEDANDREQERNSEKEEDWENFPEPLISDIDQHSIDLIIASAGGGQAQVQQLLRDRGTEIKELRGWSAVGNIIDPTPALVQLSVTRLKVAFYRFANELRGTLTAPHDLSQEEIDLFKQDVWDAAFGDYRDMIDNELIQEACQLYVADLTEALLLPRLETDKIPRLYQLDGVRFLSQRLRSQIQPYGLLFDQPGMGKTLTTLWALAAANIDRFIIVAPLTVKTQVWTLAELQLAFPLLQKDQVARTLNAALNLPEYGPAVALLHYEELRKHEEIEQLTLPRTDGSHPFEALVFDEAHNVKERLESGSSAQRAGAWILRKGVQACIGLTATPIVNELYEPVSLLHLAQNRRDATAGNRLQSRRLRDRVDVMEYLLADSLRRLKEHVLFEIPPRHIDAIFITPNAVQLERIQTFLSRGRRLVGASLAQYRRMMLDIKLDWITDRVRALCLAKTSEGMPDPKVLILCCNVEGISKSIYTHLVTRFGSERIAHIEGMTPQNERNTILKRFRSSDVSHSDLTVLVGTVGTIGVGVTLFDPESAVTPHRVIVADVPFTWAEFEQGVDRLHRVGQRHLVQVDVPLVKYGEQLTLANGAAIQSFDEWVWEWICRKRVLSDQVLDTEFNISAYKDTAVRRAISQALKDIETGGAVFAPPPPPESVQAEHRRLLGRYRALSRHRMAEHFQEPGASEVFLELNDASPSAKLAQRLARERLAQWLDRRSIVVDLGCGSNPLRDLPCAQVIGIDRHGVNGGRIGDSADTGLPTAEADFIIFSLSMWGTPHDRLCYLREAKRLLRPIGKLIIVEPLHIFGGAHTWKIGIARLSAVLEQLGMQIASFSEHIVDSGARLVAIVANNSNIQAIEHIDCDNCIWAME